MLKDFKAFLMRGNVLDLAVAVVIGVAFTAVITAIVEGIITPILGLVGDSDFSDYVITLKENDDGDVDHAEVGRSCSPPSSTSSPWPRRCSSSS